MNQTGDARQRWLAAGGAHIWLPYTPLHAAATPLIATKTEGSLIHLDDGRKLVDGVASWWTACHGYNHPHIIAAMEQQLAAMPHIMFGGLNHTPALHLAARLCALAPGGMQRVFFSDSGSVAVEVGLKMAVQYWLNRGATQRTKFISFRHAYHGDTMACMALCDPDEGMHARFKNYLPTQLLAALPETEASDAALDALLRANQARIAAMIVEPLVQGAGGMKFHSPQTLQRLAAQARKHDILLIVDEIMTGFGRTGTLFACEQAGIKPDILCLGKALTGGAISLAATLANRKICEAFESGDPDAALMHGPTYMANPLACAAANASLDLFASEPRLAQVARLAQAMDEGLAPCRGLPGVVEVRVMGAIGVVQLQAPLDVAGLKQALLTHNVWVRPFGDIVYLMPAFTIAPDQLRQLTDAVCATITAWSRAKSSVESLPRASP